MKEIDKEKLVARLSTGVYAVTAVMNGRNNKSEFGVVRNGERLEQEDITDADLIIVSQLLDSVSNVFYKELAARDLVPDELKQAIMATDAEINGKEN